MAIALVINKEEQIVPIVEGGIIRIYDTEKKEYQDFDNPANHLKEGRRGVVLKFALTKGAVSFVAPPQTFCELSYEKAKKDGIQFYSVERGMEFEEWKQLLHKKKLSLDHELKASDVAPSHAAPSPVSSEENVNN